MTLDSVKQQLSGCISNQSSVYYTEALTEVVTSPFDLFLDSHTVTVLGTAKAAIAGHRHASLRHCTSTTQVVLNAHITSSRARDD